MTRKRDYLLQASEIVEHSELEGLENDDHPQYMATDIARTISVQHTFNPLQVAPFKVGDDSLGYLVTGLNADQLDGSHATDFAAASHTHTKSQITDLEPISTTPAAGTIPLADGSGDIADGWLSSNVPLLNAANTFTRGQVIDGSADEAQLVVQSHSTQTAHPVQVQDSSAVLRYSVLSTYDTFMQGQDQYIGTITRVCSNTASYGSNFTFRRTGGSLSSYSATPSNAVIALLAGYGHDGTSETGARMRLEFKAAALWNGSAQPTQINFFTAETTSQVFRVRIDQYGNFMIGNYTRAASSKGVLHIFNDTAPTAGVANGALLYSEDVSASAEMKVMDEAGNITTLSPHNFSLFTPDPGYTFPWSYYSKNVHLGREINADIYGALKELEALTGKQFIYERELPSEEVVDWQQEQQRRVQEQAKAIAEAQADKDSGHDVEIPKPYIPKQPPAWLKERLDARAN